MLCNVVLVVLNVVKPGFLALQADSLPSEPLDSIGNQLQVHIYPPFFWISFPFSSLQSTEWSSLCYTEGSHWSSILYMVSIGCVCQSQSPTPSHPPHLTLPCPYVCSLHLCVNNFSTVLLKYKSSHRPYVNRWACLCSHETLLPKQVAGWIWLMGHSLAKSCLYLDTPGLFQVNWLFPNIQGPKSHL